MKPNITFKGKVQEMLSLSSPSLRHRASPAEHKQLLPSSSSFGNSLWRREKIPSTSPNLLQNPGDKSQVKAGGRNQLPLQDTPHLPMTERAWEIPTIPTKEHSSSSSDSPVPGALPNCCPPGMRCSWGWLWLTLPSQGFPEPMDSVSSPFPSFPGLGLYSRLTSLLLNYRCASSALGPGSARSSTSASGHPQKANTKPEDVLSIPNSWLLPSDHPRPAEPPSGKPGKRVHGSPPLSVIPSSFIPGEKQENRVFIP